MNWEKLKVFRKVAKAGSFLNASKQDNKSQSTFSRAVMDLEKDINKKLWKVEDDLRDCEQKSYFGEKFVELAREVYQLNDVRAIIKKQINQKYGSELIEEKSYKHN